MKTTRRNFIKSSIFAAVFAANGISAAPGFAAEFSSAAGDVPTDRLSYLTSGDFKKQIGAHFSLIRNEEVITAELASVTQTVKPPKAAQYLSGGSRRKFTKETFTLSFQAPVESFSQETYSVWHPTLGQFDLFLVPGKSETERVLIHAVINRV